MTRIPARVLAVLILCATASRPSAQDPCDALQAKLDAAPPGATVYAADLVALQCSAITIRKPVVLVGGFFGDPFGIGGTRGAPITLDGPGRGTVTLIGCSTSGIVGSSAGVAPGIFGGGFDALHVFNCSIQALSYCGYGYFATGDCAVTSECEASPGAPAIWVSIGTVIIEDSFVEGSTVASGGIGRLPPSPGVLAPGGLVIAINSSIAGGNAGSYFLPGPDRPCDPSERRTVQIPGGAAVECLTLKSVGSSLAGGRGARWIRSGEINACQVTGSYFYPCYQSPDGPAAVTGVGRESDSAGGVTGIKPTRRVSPVGWWNP